jgi:hypothetical protein
MAHYSVVATLAARILCVVLILLYSNSSHGSVSAAVTDVRALSIVYLPFVAKAPLVRITQIWSGGPERYSPPDTVLVYGELQNESDKVIGSIQASYKVFDNKQQFVTVVTSSQSSEVVLPGQIGLIRPGSFRALTGYPFSFEVNTLSYTEITSTSLRIIDVISFPTPSRIEIKNTTTFTLKLAQLLGWEPAVNLGEYSFVPAAPNCWDYWDGILQPGETFRLCVLLQPDRNLFFPPFDIHNVHFNVQGVISSTMP